jgi:hypothetical protein
MLKWKWTWTTGWLTCEVMAGFIPVFYVAEVEGVRFNSEVKP